MGCALLWLAPAWAETIRLKNGRKILADSVREVGDKVEYTVGEDTYAISKKLVDGIDTGGTPIVSTPQPVPLIGGTDLSGITSDDTLEAQLIKEGKIDLDLLDQLEKQPPPERAAAADFVAARHMQTKGDLREALRYVEQARSHLPGNAHLAVNQAALLAQMARYKEASAVAQEAIGLDTKLGTAHSLLGYCRYQVGDLKAAVDELKKGTALTPDPDASELLARAQRELAAEGGFDEQASNHFSLRYEGGFAAPALRQQMIDVLERHYQDLEADLDYQPKSRIQVILYTNQQYFDVTQAPKWTGALNDGKIRIPISGVTAVDSNLSRALKHELTHSFVNLITNQRAPTWLNEGLAQMEEQRSIAGDGLRLSQLYNSGHNIPLNQLETSFTKFSDAEATVAYAQSLASAQYLNDTYGMSSLTSLLKRIGTGQTTEAALRAEVHSGYAQLDAEIAAWLRKTYE